MKRINSESWQWHAAEHDQVLEEMESSRFGLTSFEAKNRLHEFGANQIKRKMKDGAIKKESNLMRRPPRKPDEPLFNKFVTFRVVIVSILMTAGTILLFNWEYSRALSNGISTVKALPKAQTIAVTFVIMFQIFYMINCRSLKDSVFRIGIFSNYTIFIGIGTILTLQALFIYIPFMQKVFGTTSLDFRDILVSGASGFVIFPLIGIEKFVLSVYAKRK